ncbi:MAG TPA: hypothetical protein VHT27_05245 [Solirubrobacteraceae bacterium]|nr:hypothetical protein [Solirubrobacteraceae bacterium]
MAVEVVDLLEVVEIEHDHRELAAGASEAAELALALVAKRALVRQARQRVLGSLAFEALDQPGVREGDRRVPGVGRQRGRVAGEEHGGPVCERHEQPEQLIPEDQWSSAHRAERCALVPRQLRERRLCCEIVDEYGAASAQLGASGVRPVLQCVQRGRRDPGVAVRADAVAVVEQQYELLAADRDPRPRGDLVEHLIEAQVGGEVLQRGHQAVGRLVLLLHAPLEGARLTPGEAQRPHSDRSLTRQQHGPGRRQQLGCERAPCAEHGRGTGDGERRARETLQT